MNPYDIDYSKLPESKKITNETQLMKMKLVAMFLQITEDMDTSEILERTGLHKSDLSRLRVLTINRFTIDRIVGLLDSLGFCTDIKVHPKKVS